MDVLHISCNKLPSALHVVLGMGPFLGWFGKAAADPDCGFIVPELNQFVDRTANQGLVRFLDSWLQFRPGRFEAGECCAFPRSVDPPPASRRRTDRPVHGLLAL